MSFLFNEQPLATFNQFLRKFLIEGRCFMETKRLQRSKTERMIGGVCGGLANYFDVDTTIVRLLFVLSFFFLYPGTILVYVLLLIIMPEEN